MSIWNYSNNRADDRGITLLCPPARLSNGSPNPDVLRWTRDAVGMGLDALKSERAYPDIDKAIEIFCGVVNDKLPRKLSRVRDNVIKRDVRELLAIQSNIKPFWCYESANREYEEQNNILNKRMHYWYFDQFVDRSIKGALQWAATSTGYLESYWQPATPHSRGEIKLRVRGPKDVLPIHMGSHNDYQQAYAVAIRETMPLVDAVRNWPQFADLLKPTRWPTRGLARLADAMFNSPFLSFMKRGDTDETGKYSAFPTVDLYYIYVDDRTVNTTGRRVAMGSPGEPWYYEVPSVGDRIANGYDKTGAPQYREATDRDCYLYPNRRLIICTDTCVIYDDTSRYWHGRVPLTKFTIDGWIFSYLGFALHRDVAPLQDSAISLMRAIDDMANARLSPFRIWNRNSGIAKGDMERINPRVPDNALMANLNSGDKVVEFPLGFEYYNVPSYIPEYARWLVERIDHSLAVPDTRSFAKAKQIPSGDSVQKIMELSGPLSEDLSRSIEQSLRELGTQIMYNFFQFDTTARRFKLMGFEGTDKADFDFDPGNLIPSHMPDEDPEGGASKYTQVERAKSHVENFSFMVTPNSLNSLTSSTRKMLMVQLAKTQALPIDWWTLGDALEFNVGNRPDEPTMLGRWLKQQEMTAKFQANLQKEVTPNPPPNGDGGGPEGRPPSFQEMPQQIVRSDGNGGQRSVISTSGR
jgi:hypothetical protein